jgi:2-methylisocitrate lyase-like PEP mutase family enzyme
VRVAQKMSHSGEGERVTLSQSELASQFRQLHARRPLVLPNAWDAASARVIEQAGAAAVATTSAGISWAHGRGDGQALLREEMLEATRHIIRTVSVPVTADIESGYGSGSPDEVARTVRVLVDMGVVGINLEDSPGHAGRALLEPEEHAERIRAARAAARAAGGDLVINARTDVYLSGHGGPDERLEAAVRRVNLYRSAGADCSFVPGVIDRVTVAALVAAVDGPLNIMAMPGAPSPAELGELGVARVSVGPVIAQVALAATRRATRELLERGSYGDPQDAMPFGEANGLFAGGAPARAQEPSRVAAQETR